MSYGVSERPTGPQVWQLALLTVLTVVVTMLLVTVGTVFGIASGSVSSAIILRSLAGLFALTVLFMYFASRWGVVTVQPWALTALATYVVNPFSWNGKLLFGQFLGPIPVAILVDAIVWVGVGLLIARWQGRPRPQRRDEAATSY